MMKMSVAMQLGGFFIVLVSFGVNFSSKISWEFLVTLFSELPFLVNSFQKIGKLSFRWTSDVSIHAVYSDCGGNPGVFRENCISNRSEFCKDVGCMNRLRLQVFLNVLNVKYSLRRSPYPPISRHCNALGLLWSVSACLCRFILCNWKKDGRSIWKWRRNEDCVWEPSRREYPYLICLKLSLKKYSLQFEKNSK